MLKKFATKAALAAFVSLAAMGAAAAQTPRGTLQALETLSGVYASEAPESWYGSYGTRHFAFENGRWELNFTHALDPKMEKKTFRFRTLGPYRIAGSVASVPGSFHAVFVEAQKFVTLLTDDPAVAAAMGLAACGLKPNVETDISQTGCGPWKPVAQCGEDHDLVALDGNRLWFGVRPRDNDMCTPDKRPTALLEPPIVKR
jgi:hypothetical protein